MCYNCDAVLTKKNKPLNYLKSKENTLIFANAQGEMAEWSNAAVLKTVEGHTSGGSNPSFSAKENPHFLWVFIFYESYRPLS